MQHNDQKTISESSLAFANTDVQQQQDLESSQVLTEIEAQVLDDVRGSGLGFGRLEAGLSYLKKPIKGQTGRSTSTSEQNYCTTNPCRP